MDSTLVRQVRSFNRVATQTIGALHDDYLGRHRPLGESRLLFEIGDAGATASELRARLDLDSGYLSRLSRSLERQGLVVTQADPSDKRVRQARLTLAGRRELALLNRDSDRLAQSILTPLNAGQRERLAAAMGEVERLLSASAARIEEIAPAHRDAEYCLGRYFAELAERFEVGFDPRKSLSPTHEEFVPPNGVFLAIRLHGQPVGCGGFKRDAPGIAYIKRMWVSREVRGLGLGRRLLAELEERARTLGYRKVRLETQQSLTEAQALYRAAGYVEVEPFNDEPYAHHWFEKTLR
jgi:DNA-binding MarR family transcriptional regulator